MTATISRLQHSLELTNRGLVSEALWNRLVNRIVKDEGMELSLAERIMNQTLGFLRLCALEPNGHYSPSELVDVGWHTFILYTREYAAFCQKFGGQFIHHAPSDEEGVDYGTDGVALTVAALQRHGFYVDMSLWEKSSSKCCHPTCQGTGGGCRSGR